MSRVRFQKAAFAFSYINNNFSLFSEFIKTGYGEISSVARLFSVFLRLNFVLVGLDFCRCSDECICAFA